MKERLVYIDVLRGLAMFTVVYSHILLFCLDPYPESWFISFLRISFVHTFFFISGYMAYRNMDWNINTTIKYIYKKVKTLLIPTIVCGCTFMFSHQLPLDKFISSDAKYGYWFTYVLFFIFVFYAIYMLCCSKIKNEKYIFSLLFIIGILCYPLQLSSLIHGEIQDILSFSKVTGYIPFFIFGVLCKKYYNFFNQKILQSKFIIIAAFTFIVLHYLFGISYLINLHCVFLLIFYLSKQLVPNGKVQYSYPIKFLSYVGTHSLEVYFLHYFLLFPLPIFIRNYLTGLSENTLNVLGSSTSFPEFLIICPIVVCICFACIAISSILKQIPYVSMLAFGKQSSILQDK